MLIKSTLSSFFLLIGIFFVAVGSVGVIRLPGTFNKLHAVGVSDTVGVLFISIGIAILQNTVIMALRVIGFALIYWSFSPLVTYAIARAKYLSKSRDI
jgi:multicomponent Na+:H+ antiporter subunit G